MLLTRAYHQLDFTVARKEGSGRICYFLLPEGVLGDIAKWSEQAAERYGCNIVLMTGMDWNRDMSPWPAEGVMRKRKGFGGGAALFAESLAEDYLPMVESWLGIRGAERYLLGISLSGLFSLWVLSRTQMFAGAASISGSFWYDGFTGWLEKTAFPLTAKVYLSLGEKEKNAADKRLATVEDRTKEVVSILTAKGLTAVLEMVSGTHFSPAVPRFEKAMAYLAGA